MMNSFPFLMLPGELRNMVYDEMLQELHDCNNEATDHETEARKVADCINFSATCQATFYEFGPLLVDFLRKRRLRIEVLTLALSQCYAHENAFLTDLDAKAIEIPVELREKTAEDKMQKYALLPSLRFLREHSKLNVVFQKDEDFRGSCDAMNALVKMIRTNPGWADEHTKDIKNVEIKAQKLGPVRILWRFTIVLEQKTPLSTWFKSTPKVNRSFRKLLNLELDEWHRDWKPNVKVEYQYKTHFP